MSETRVEEKSFRGKPVLEIVEWESDFSDKYIRVCFGLRKACLIMNHLKEIKEFIKEHTRKEE